MCTTYISWNLNRYGHKDQKRKKKGDRNTNHISLEGLTDAHNFDIKECKTTGVTKLQIFSLSKLHFFTVSQFQL